jgi:hypothetical protein
MLGSNCSLVIGITQKAKYRIHVAAKNLNETCIFSKIDYHSAYLSGTSVASISESGTTAMMVLMMAGK